MVGSSSKLRQVAFDQWRSLHIHKLESNHTGKRGSQKAAQVKWFVRTEAISSGLFEENQETGQFELEVMPNQCLAKNFWLLLLPCYIDMRITLCM